MLGMGEVRVTAAGKKKEKLEAKRQEVRKNASEQYKKTKLLRDHDIEVLIAEKCANKLGLGSHQIQKFITRYHNRGSSLNLDQFISALDRLGFNEFPVKRLEETFDTYSKDSKVDIFEFAKGVVAKFKAAASLNSEYFKADVNSKALQHQQNGQLKAWNASKIDAEAVLIEKIEQRGIYKVGKSKLSRVFNQKIEDKCPPLKMMDFNIFKGKLYEFGVQGVSDKDILKMFQKYDIENTGFVEYDVFVKHFTTSYLQRNKLSTENVGSLADQMSQCNAASEKRRYHNRMKNSYLRAEVDPKDLFFEKVNQTCAESYRELRRLFRRTDQAEDSLKLTFNDFKQSLIKLGITGLSNYEMLSLFKMFDVASDGTIFIDAMARKLMDIKTEASEIVVKEKKHRHCRHRRNKSKHKKSMVRILKSNIQPKQDFLSYKDPHVMTCR